ncbi:hypothetical protein IW492_11450 [Enterococcus sp. BWB1-3]|uniref:DUF6531 domain-containing protein n=1 Tax=Enterococcus sp. BWB1-3 TaxID=2787713 RepID=UPI00192084B2|nr:DUF6531 domain-containing protein [Enterococcus sp. BWB1-3]MBL1229847.1 hypothetical protein [Enterococcus sp. BWB1-3]
MKNKGMHLFSSQKKPKRITEKENMISSKRVRTDLLDSHYRHFDFDPVDVISGAYNYRHIDFETKGQIPLCWSWLWESVNNRAGSLGNRISFIYDEHLEIDAEEGVIYHIDQEGKQIEFPWLLGDQVYHALFRRVKLKAVKGAYILTDYKLKQELTFIQSKISGDYYQLKEVKNFLGFKLELFYNETGQLEAIIDSNQQEFSVQFNNQGFIQSLLYKGKKLAEYEYSDDGNLLSVSDVEGEQIRFTYNENHLMTKRQDKNLTSFHWRYDQFGRVIHTWGDGHIKEGWIEYHENLGYNLVTDYYGGQTKYQYNRHGLVKEISLPTGGYKRYCYDEKQQLIREQMVDGKIISYSYNELGWLVEKESSDGRKEKYSYDKYGSRQYSDEKKTQIIEYNKYGQIFIEILDACKKIMTYNNFGYISKLIRIKGTNRDIFYYNYDEKNRLITINQNDDLIRMYKYDKMDHITQLKIKSGEIVELRYDKTGKVSTINCRKINYSFSYDFNGRLLKAKKKKSKYFEVET